MNIRMPPDGDRRLPGTVTPERYRLELTLDPAAPRFSGRAVIDVRLSAPHDLIDLHGDGLRLHEAVVARGERRLPLTVRTGRAGGLSLEAPEPLPPGPATLELAWEADLDEVPEGVYRSRVHDRWYLFTQFEPLAARSAFPCFDEPRFKAPLELTLRVPHGLVALANSREIRRERDGELDRVVFAPTPPIASYVAAFAVGPFEVVEAPPGECPVPLRVVTTAGQGHLADFALRVTPPLLASLARWCGTPYPYDKLDLVGVPDFSAGAMENVALVTFRERLLLLDDRNAAAHDRLWAQIVIAHELAHMWFGNLVTMHWWDDLWLNEAFATWLETLVVDEVEPELDARLEAVRETGNVMDHDALIEARAIRQPIADGGDVLNAFDGITYGKGAAVVQMTERWLGTEAFRAGVRRYLERHAHGNAATDELLAALGEASGQPVAEVLAGFLDQPGTPLIDVRPDAADPRQVTLQQRRYRPAGGRTAPPARWRVPVSLRYGRADEVHTTSLLLDEPNAAVRLAVAPEWIHPNHDEAGYYRWRLPEPLLLSLTGAARHRLTPAERVALPAHLWALLEADDLTAATWCAAVADLAAEPHRLVVAAVVDGFTRLSRVVVPDPRRLDFAAFVTETLRPHLERLGHRPRRADDANDRLLRPIVLRALADIGEDQGVVRTLCDTAWRVLADFGGSDPEQAQVALPSAALHEGAPFFDRLVAVLPDAPTPAHRAAAVRALAASPDPDRAERGFDLLLGDDLRAQDLFSLLRPALRRQETLRRLWDWLDRHYDAVVHKIGDEMATQLPTLAAGFRAGADRQRVEAFFAAPGRRKSGTQRPLRQALEEIARNARLAEACAGSLISFLDARSASA